EFSDYTQLPELGDQPSDRQVLRYAMGREQAAMQQYTTLAREAPPGPIADLFQYLANEEQEHLKKLEKQYYEIDPGA
ncbi:MAG: ferritin family protein, partial [Gammaproteobacteria bacterium]|nr:ferritin family protein [Gammaproteobacteria bacterium]